MSGHSKWHKLKNKKGKTDAARANVFTKLCRAVTVAAMQGGGDPNMNFTLRLSIEKARAANVPKDNIERAIKRGSGEGADGAVLASLLYEGFGPGGSAFLIETLTDNRNRTVSDVKHIMNVHGGTLGNPNSVAWQFTHQAVIHLSEEEAQKLTDDAELTLIDAGATDIRRDGTAVIYSAPDHLEKILTTLSTLHITPEESGFEWVPVNMVPLGEEETEQAMKLFEALEEHDDVRAVYTNIA